MSTDKKIYFTKNDIWRAVGVLFIIAGQFTERTISYTYVIDKDNSITFATSELSIVGIATFIVFPLIMRYLENKKGDDHV